MILIKEREQRSITDTIVGSGDAADRERGHTVIFDRDGDATTGFAACGKEMRLKIIMIGRILFALSVLLAAASPSLAGPISPRIAVEHAAAMDRLPATEVASRYYTPQRGSAERSAIMDAARVPVSAAIGQTVIFQVSVLRTDGDWAYLQAEPRNPDGSALDWSRTRFAQDWAMDAMSDVIMVLLRRSGSGFQVVDHIIGPTDVAWYDWLDRYGLPEALFYER